jgi:hypothetical protein
MEVVLVSGEDDGLIQRTFADQAAQLSNVPGFRLGAHDEELEIRVPRTKGRRGQDDFPLAFVLADFSDDAAQKILVADAPAPPDGCPIRRGRPIGPLRYPVVNN